jgi:hypothetical protein
MMAFLVAHLAIFSPGAKLPNFTHILEGTSQTAVVIGRHYDWVRDPAYRRAFERAKEGAADRLEGEARRRAVDGVEEPVGWYQGKPGGLVRKYSDRLLVLLLKAWIPERYKDRIEATNLLKLNPDEMTEEQLEALAEYYLTAALGTDDPEKLAAARAQLEGFRRNRQPQRSSRTQRRVPRAVL